MIEKGSVGDSIVVDRELHRLRENETVQQSIRGASSLQHVHSLV